MGQFGCCGNNREREELPIRNVQKRRSQRISSTTSLSSSDRSASICIPTYEVSLPPQKLEFSNCNGDDAFKQELAAVSLKEFSDVEAMLKQETSEFKLSIIIACALAYLKGLPNSSEFLNDDGRKEADMTAKSQDTSHITRVPLGVTKSFPKGKYSVICLYAKKFQELRNCCCPELQYIASICRCKNWDAKGGKSKSFFAKTLDDRFILKEIKKTELESFVKFAPLYFDHMEVAMTPGNQTCLAKILGIYQVILRQTKSGKQMKHDLMIMENLSFGRKITCQYDLKGALHARFNSSVDNNAANVRLDKNFVVDMNRSQLYVSDKAKALLGDVVEKDTTFLNSINVMDYSLLVGVDTNGQELVCGIIDYLRQYTWDKKMETWVKTLFVPRNVSPTIISPIEYKKRFEEFMSTHFVASQTTTALIYSPKSKL